LSTNNFTFVLIFVQTAVPRQLFQ